MSPDRHRSRRGGRKRPTQQSASAIEPEKPPIRRPRGTSTHWLSYAMIVLGVFVVSAAVSISTDRRPTDEARPRIAVPPVSAGTPRTTPAVASRGPRTRSAAASSVQFESVLERPPTIQHIDVEHAEGRTRLTIASDARARFQIERRDEARLVDITVDAATQDDPTAALDLVGTPIRSLRTRSLPRRTVLTLTLDTPQRIRTRWTQGRGDSTLVIELEGLSDAGESASSDRSSSLRTQERVRDDAPPAHSSYAVVRDAEADIWHEEKTARDVTRADNGYTREDSWNDIDPLLAETETLAAPAALLIERSAADRLRTDREQTERRADESIRNARLAHSGGDLTQAVSHYLRALDTLPGHRRAIFEVSPLLVELGRLDDAIALVRLARERAPEEAGLTMLHAQLVERTGDVTGAILVLERAAPNPADAPEIHALAAAYLQQTGEHELAIDRYETLLRRHPGQSRWWMGLGISFEAAGREADALDVYRIAMQVGELSAQSRRWVAARVQDLSEEG